MNTRIERDRTAIRAYLSGRIDAAAATQLTELLAQLQNSGCSQVTLDFEDIEFIGSSGIGILRQFQQSIASRGGTVSIVRCRPDIAQVFKIARLDRLFSI